MLKTSTVVLSLFLCLNIAFGDLLICGKCGYENEDGADRCTHCNAELEHGGDAEGNDGTDSRPVTGGKGIGFLDSRVVETEIRLGDKYRAQGNLPLARMVYRNAAALDMLTDPGKGKRRAKRIAANVEKCTLLQKSFKRKCPVCNGSGTAMMLSQNFTGQTTYREVAGRKCRSCYGAGALPGFGTGPERAAELGKTLRAYVRLQKSRKFAPVGNAWIPMALEGRLSDRQRARLMRTVAAPCRTCMGLGRTACTACKGTGLVKCGGRGCRQGMVESELEGGLMKSGVKRRTKCKTCGGKGMVGCEACKSVGNVVCPECKGRGERSQCSKCAGQGTVACGKCSGVGVVDGEECTECRGGGAVLCESCNGDGRAR